MAAVSCEGTCGRYQFIEKLRSDAKVVVLLRLLGVTKSGHYYWQKHQSGTRGIKDQKIRVKIQAIYDEHESCNGSPLIFKVLRSLAIRLIKNVSSVYIMALSLLLLLLKHRIPGLKHLLVTGIWRYLSVIMALYFRRVIS